MTTKSFAELLTSIKGKTIENVSANANDSGGNPIILYFTDGTEMTFCSEVTFQGNEEHAAESRIVLE